MRLIDADALLEKARDADIRLGHVQTVNVWDILEAPTIDLIRCRDCKWYKRSHLKKDGTDDMRYMRDFCIWHQIFAPAEYYCADGEREEDGEEHNHDTD